MSKCPQLVAGVSRAIGLERDIAIHARRQKAPMRRGQQPFCHGLEVEDVQAIAGLGEQAVLGKQLGRRITCQQRTGCKKSQERTPIRHRNLPASFVILLDPPGGLFLHTVIPLVPHLWSPGRPHPDSIGCPQWMIRKPCTPDFITFRFATPNLG